MLFPPGMAYLSVETHVLVARLWVAIIAPPSVGIDRITASIHKNLAEINAEAMFRLHERSQNIEIEVVNSGKTIQQLKLDAEESSRVMKRMEATNEELLLSLKEQREKMNAYVCEVERKSRATEL
jgi:intracellular sulfur oxidation DsrE/DsrF family protein